MTIEELKKEAELQSKLVLSNINKVSGWKGVIVPNGKRKNIRAYMNTWYDLDNNEKITFVVWKGLGLPLESFRGPIK